MKLLCKLFGHKPELYGKDLVCVRCFKVFNSKIINRSDLDESENVFPEKWLDKHMD
ncbi:MULTISPECIES: DUF1660 domain-containing protein [unclassified Lactococcus]|uniref:DUF1660 domain-containing protein n=1 Tax=unclassified Lactococcus TaxID=2643510 RepID=UPI0014307F4F|nr:MULTISPECIES: DUF1660 domain-containing protein [unclassified Lactococcus]KAF6606013.1 DUF1660 domain-containing protein [Lactococcus sp. EKM201L]KAF6612196.1 DUF1660 domain-containing protein [Lactococcus sp. EKM203L]KAF6641379.1 DUF1660 domain-containing protein [Lactococcus sp. EKM502L]KAF6641462.1 DUF1660 domain-containing protein [Lactococcus sp. EKM501L]KAF6652327.1 DUF1660 domain-containing protein [Lactococcus sp. EKM101L]